jgi:hypothetical protein
VEDWERRRIVIRIVWVAVRLGELLQDISGNNGLEALQAPVKH